MKSFARFNPAPTEGGYKEKRQAVFYKWLQCNAPHVKRVSKYDPKVWRTAKPWLAYVDVYKCFREYKKRTLGSIRLGSYTLTDEEVSRAVYFEKNTKVKRDLDTTCIMNVVDSLYEEGDDFISIQIVFKEINNELHRLGYRRMCIQAQAWKELNDNIIKNAKGQFKLKRRFKYYHIVSAIATIMKPAAKDIDKETLRQEVAFYLDNKKEMPPKLFDKAVEITGTKLQRRYTDVMPYVHKLFIHIPAAKAMKKTDVAAYTNHILDPPIPLDAHVWDIDTHLVKRFTGKLRLNMYEINRGGGNPPGVDVRVTLETLIQMHQNIYKCTVMQSKACVKEQLLETFGTTQPNLRQKTEIDWEYIKQTYMKRGFTMTPQKDIQTLCDIILKEYGIQMIPQDPTLDFIKSQGLIIRQGET